MVSPMKSPIQISTKKNFVPSDQIDQLLDKVDIVSLIESYGLQGFKRNSALRATCLCPFHDDKNPSLQINGERGIYKCFSCGAGGNALRFIRAYSEKYPAETRRRWGGIVDVTKTNEPLTFVEAIRILEDCASTMPMVGGVTMRKWSGNGGNSTSSGVSIANKKTNFRHEVGSTSRERILHANLFAAAYFEESLFGLPSAGSARMHLRSRGVHPTTVKAFAMGFAPETYFLGESSKGRQQKRSWGEGSLVNRLRDEGFTPQEILDAGLAIITRKGREQQLQQQKEGHKETSSDDKENHDATGLPYEHKDFSTIMDRFRGRLIVPIFDANGKYVLGFGGRILETSQDAQSDFKAAKYLNSPESVVFQKKDILFGSHMVKDSLETASSKDVATVGAKHRPRSVIIVEGYMDAIALWQAGVQETVASMGTALTREQLVVAAEKARKIGGRVVLCLDNDNAGLAAVKRLCSGPDPILLSVMEESNIEFLIAELPGAIKDPAEFLEEFSDSEEALDEKFRAEVIDGAKEWTRWYMNSLIAEHRSSSDTGENEGAFSKLFDSLAMFLSVFKDVNDQMKKAAIIAPKLAELVDTDKNNNERDFNRTETSSTIRIQLASDLIDKAANIVHMKSMANQGNYRTASNNAAIVPKSLEIGNDLASSDNEVIVPKSLQIGNDISIEEGSKKKSNQKRSPKITNLENSHQPTDFETSSSQNRSSRWQQNPTATRRDFKPFQKSMTKHIGGVSATPFDDEWLGVTTDKYTNERIPLRFDAVAYNNEKYVGPEEIVRFNKNDYHGTWATPRSVAAGYTSQPKSKSLDFLDRGTSSLIESDGEDQSLFVENLLFSILTRFSEARQSLYDSIRISEASGSNSDVRWSEPEREWLFKCLVSEIHKIPQEIVGLDNLSELRSYLSLRPDAFPGAFGSTVRATNEDIATIETSNKEKKSGQLAQIVDSSSDAEKISSDKRKPQTVENRLTYQGDLEISDGVNTKPLGQPPTNSIPKIPAIGEEWSDFADTDGMPDLDGDFGGIDDMLMDSVGPIMESFDPSDSLEQIDEAMSFKKAATESLNGTNGHSSVGDSEIVAEVEVVNQSDNTESVDATLVAAEDDGETIVQEGSLDRIFMEGTEVCDIFNKFYADQDAMSLGSNEDKAKFAAQDLYTILQFTSVLKRVEDGRRYMRENTEEWFSASSNQNSEIGSSRANEDNAAISNPQNIELLEYCSSQNSDVGLRSDLRRLRNLADKNSQATQRVLDMMDAEFTDTSADLRGYNWLGNVLKFNEMKLLEWNDIIEAKESFSHSQEEVEALEDIVYSDWNELCDENEMWEFDKNVDLNHRSHFADLVVDRPDTESPASFAERYAEEWDIASWEHEYDQTQATGEEGFDDGVEQQEYEADEVSRYIGEPELGDYDN